jgi:hypothetical protein
MGNCGSTHSSIEVTDIRNTARRDAKIRRSTQIITSVEGKRFDGCTRQDMLAVW